MFVKILLGVFTFINYGKNTMNKKLITLLLITFSLSLSAIAKNKNFFANLQKSLKPDKVLIYNEIANRKLELHLFFPKNYKASDKRPAFVAIHGGGWTSGDPQRFYPYAHCLVDKGYVGISIQYRLYKKGKTSVFDCVKDGRSAIRYIRAHAKELGIDPDKIAVAGGSAGAHVAAGTALFNEFNNDGDDLTVSPKPNALILLFAVLDTSTKGYGNARCGKKWQSISPVHQVKEKMPPTLMFHGTKDGVANMTIVNQFKKAMKSKRNSLEMVIENGAGHGHINNDKKLFDDAVSKMAQWLKTALQ